MRSSTFAVVSDRQLRLRAKSKRNTTVVCSRLCADARGIQNRGKRKPERHSTTCCHTAECSPSIALAQCALGCKPQMCGRLLRKGCNQDQTCVPHHACAPPRRNKARVKAQSPAGYGRGHCGSVGPSLPRLFGPISPAACRGMRRPGGCLRGLRPNRGFELWVPE